jgi:ATP-dependent phosphofructokinase / diphosphate-dependent phosphofructokinase
VRIGMLTGGGDAPGLNAAIRAVALRALDNGHSVVGVRNGWKGMVGTGDLMEMSRQDFSGLLRIGGTILGSSRVNPMKLDGGVDQCLATMREAGMDALVAMGGDDTLSVAARLASEGAPVVGVPKTMDNDLSVTEYCIGFDTAVAVATEAIDRLHTTSASHHRLMVLEVMGRDTGWVALMGGLAGGAAATVIPEFPVSLDAVCEQLVAQRSRGNDHGIVVVAEGSEMPELGGREDAGGERDAFGHVRLARRAVGERLAEGIEGRTGIEVRTTVLGYIQRGGSPTAFDRIWATRVGEAAEVLVEEGRFGMMPVVRDGGVQTAPIADVVAEQRKVPRELYELTQIVD